MVSTYIARSELDDVLDLNICLTGFQLALGFLLLLLSFACILVYATPN